MEFIHISIGSNPNVSKYEDSVLEIAPDPKRYRKWLSKKKKTIRQSLGPGTYSPTSTSLFTTDPKNVSSLSSFASHVERFPDPDTCVPGPYSYDPHVPPSISASKPSPVFVTESVPPKMLEDSPGPGQYEDYDPELVYPTLTPGHLCVFKSKSQRFGDSEIPIVAPNSFIFPSPSANVLSFDAYSPHSTNTWLQTTKYKASPASYLPVFKKSNPIPKFSTEVKDLQKPSPTAQIGPGTYSIEQGFQKLSKSKQPICPKWCPPSAAPSKKPLVERFYDIERAEKAMQVLSKQHRLPKLNENGLVDWV